MRYIPYFLLFTYFSFVSCTTNLEKKEEETPQNQKKDTPKTEKESEVRPDSTEKTAENSNIDTEKGFNASEADLKDIQKRHTEPSEKKEPKDKEKDVKKNNEEPVKVLNPNIAEVVKDARAKYAYVGNFHNGLAVVQSHEKKYGYIDQNGKEVLSLEYDFAEDLEGEPAMARIRLKDKVGYIGQNGKEIVPLKYRYIDKFFKGLAHARLPDGETLYIDKQGNHVCDVIGDYHEGIARIKKGDKIGYINNYGQVIVKPQYNYGTHFTNGQAEVKIGEKYKIINTKGECIKDCD